MINNDFIENNLPNHIAIIMDGNRRWALKRGLQSIAGHKHGIKALKEIIKATIDFKIRELTVFAFSTENWSRGVKEVKNLQKLLEITLKSEIAEINSKNIRIKYVGELSCFDNNLKDLFSYSENLTKNNNLLKLNIAINYGAKLDIITAAKKVAEKVKNKKLNLDNISEEIFKENLISSNVSDIDLLIRTSGEKRLSNFMFWQLTYSEIFFSNVLWPDFNKKDLLEAILEFSNRKRTFGASVSNQ